MFKTAVVASLLALAVSASAQTDPRTLPLWDGNGISLAGTFNVPDTDGAGVMIDYGGNGAGVSEDGKYLYVGCFKTPNESNHSGRGLYVKLEIPALGAMARIVENCKGLSYTQLGKVHPDPTAYHPSSAGIVEIGGRVIVSGYITYDAAGTTTRSHWSGTSLSNLSGPYFGTVSPGLVKGQMGVIPAEWRTLLGGDVFATAGYTSIISRSSLGPAFTVFSSTSVTRDGFSMKMLQGCLHSVPLCQTYGSPQNIAIYNGPEESGSSFFVGGTRTLVAMEREAEGPTCYGYATRVQADHGKPYLDAVKCYSLTDALDQKGPKGYPYRFVWKLFDVNGLVDVAQGRKQPYENNVPYKVVNLPGSAAGDTIGYYGGATYNPVRGEFYLVRELHGSIRVYTGFPKAGSPPPPPPVTNCVPGVTTYTFVSATECTGTRTVTESWVRTGDIPETGGGASCGPTTGTRTRSEACTPPPPPVEVCGDGIDNDKDGLVDEGCEPPPPPPPTTVTYECWVTGTPSGYADGDVKRTVRCNTNGVVTTLPTGTTFTVTVNKK